MTGLEPNLTDPRQHYIILGSNSKIQNLLEKWFVELLLYLPC